MWNVKGHKQILEGALTEIFYNFSDLQGPMGPQVKLHKGPIRFSGAQWNKTQQIHVRIHGE